MIVLFAASAQNPKGFDKMCQKNMKGTVPLITAQKLIQDYYEKKEIILLDTREKKEFLVSHIQGAIWVGYDTFDESTFLNIKKTSTVVLYCSIGVRSELIGEKFQDKGYQQVFNLYGGIFNWINNGHPIEDQNNVATKRVHGFDSKWAKWIDTKSATILLN